MRTAAKTMLGLAAMLALCVAGHAAEAVGASTCAGCHAEKAEAFRKTDHGRVLPVVKGIVFEKTCETCHGPGSEHAAAGGDKSNPGFATIINPAKAAPGKASELCLSCHKSQELMFWQVGAHAQNKLSCVQCHSVHAGQGKKNLKLSKTETCLQCHKNKRAGLDLPSHHPIREGKMSCSDCHNPHGGETGNLRAESAESLCFKCHEEKAGPFLHEHPPVAESCLNCHNPHGSMNERLLVKRLPGLCMGCHKWPHMQRTGVNNAFPNTTTLLQRSRCTDCHFEIHGSDRRNTFKR